MKNPLQAGLSEALGHTDEIEKLKNKLQDSQDAIRQIAHDLENDMVAEATGLAVRCREEM